MINFDDFKNKTKHNLKWACIPDHPYRILIIGGPASEKTNASLNSINNQLDIDKIYLYAKDPYQFLINKRERAGIKHFNDPKAFIEYSNDVQEVYSSGVSGGVRWVRTHCPPNIMCPFLMKLKFKNQL